LYDGPNIVQELQGGTPTANLLTGGLDETFLRSDSTGARNLLTDALGSTIALSDGTGMIQTQYTYDPFGSTIMSGEASGNVSEYTGRELDEAGLYFYRARYYDPSIGRFISEDPIGLAGGVNLYAYAQNDPVSMYDPLGLSGEDSSSKLSQITATLQRLLDLLPKDPECLKFLCRNNGNPIQTLQDLLQLGAYGVSSIQPAWNNAQTGYIQGQALTVNTTGGFFNQSYNGSPLMVDRGRIQGGTPQAQGFILLHELGHLVDALDPDLNNKKTDDENNKMLENNCKKLIKALGGH
jgi:RHS repeat-associated protein